MIYRILAASSLTLALLAILSACSSESELRFTDSFIQDHDFTVELNSDGDGLDISFTPQSDASYQLTRSSESGCSSDTCADYLAFTINDDGTYSDSLPEVIYYYNLMVYLPGIGGELFSQYPNAISVPLNDTGIDWSGGSVNRSYCSDGYEPQDCHQGRDVIYNNDSDGRVGFSFTKLGSSGEILTDSAAEWSCVKDNVTGLTWEVKTDDGGLHERTDTYNWYNGSLGYANDDGYICYGYDDSNSSTYCNTEAFVDRVNAVGLCGAKDWRLPVRNELLSIADLLKSPSIDTSYFPNSLSSIYWSSSPYSSISGNAWAIYFSSGLSREFGHDNNYYVRLVRFDYTDITNDWPNSRYEIHGDGTVTDIVTGLMWLQCSLGQDLSDNCSDSASKYDWQDALDIAESYNLGNYSDWRLPNIKELVSLAALDRHNPTINSTVFPNTPSDWYWSSSPYDGFDGYILWLSFDQGDESSSHSSSNLFVRLVRSGQ